MSVTTLSDAVLAWVAATLPELKATYDAPTTEKPGALPDAMIAVREITPRRVGQQAWERRIRVNVSILENPEPQRTATRSLWDMCDRLLVSAVLDPTLGTRVMRSEGAAFTLEAEPLTWPDGTRGWPAVLTLDVYEALP